MSRASMTLHQLRIFWTVAHANTLTRASKQLGLAQPSLSQQLAKLEEGIGAKLFERTRTRMELTDAGRFLLRKAETILSNVDEAEEGLKEFSEGTRGLLRIAGVNSVLRVLLPGAVERLMEVFPDIELDVHEAAPVDTLELLYARHVNVGLVASNSIAEAGVSFHQTPIAHDPYVFAVPDTIDLRGVKNPDVELAPAARRVVNNCIQFSFGTTHTRRVARWYQDVLPNHRLIAQVRTYEVALSMVQAGLGVCLVPAFTAFAGSGPLPGINLYMTGEPERPLVALMAAQHTRMEPYRTFLKILQEVGSAIDLPVIENTPPFLLHRADASNRDAVEA